MNVPDDVGEMRSAIQSFSSMRRAVPMKKKMRIRSRSRERGGKIEMDRSRRDQSYSPDGCNLQDLLLLEQTPHVAQVHAPPPPPPPPQPWSAELSSRQDEPMVQETEMLLEEAGQVKPVKRSRATFVPDSLMTQKKLKCSKQGKIQFTHEKFLIPQVSQIQAPATCPKPASKPPFQPVAYKAPPGVASSDSSMATPSSEEFSSLLARGTANVNVDARAPGFAFGSVCLGKGGSYGEMRKREEQVEDISSDESQGEQFGQMFGGAPGSFSFGATPETDVSSGIRLPKGQQFDQRVGSSTFSAPIFGIPSDYSLGSGAFSVATGGGIFGSSRSMLHDGGPHLQGDQVDNANEAYSFEELRHADVEKQSSGVVAKKYEWNDFSTLLELIDTCLENKTSPFKSLFETKCGIVFERVGVKLSESGLNSMGRKQKVEIECLLILLLTFYQMFKQYRINSREVKDCQEMSDLKWISTITMELETGTGFVDRIERSGKTLVCLMETYQGIPQHLELGKNWKECVINCEQALL